MESSFAVAAAAHPASGSGPAHHPIGVTTAAAGRDDDEAVHQQAHGHRVRADPHAACPKSLGDRGQEQHQGEQHRHPDVPVGRLAGCRPLLEGMRRLVVQVLGLLQLGVAVLRHVPGAGRRGRVGERLRLQPCLEGAAVLGGEPADQRRLQPGVARGSGLEPGGEHRGVGRQLLARQGGGGVGLEAGPARLGVQHRLVPVAPGRLVTAPGGGHGGDRKGQHLEDLDDLLPAALGPLLPLTLAQLVGDLDVHPLGHGWVSIIRGPSWRWLPSRGR
jgi:hypothetical protein